MSADCLMAMIGKVLLISLELIAKMLEMDDLD